MVKCDEWRKRRCINGQVQNETKKGKYPRQSLRAGRCVAHQFAGRTLTLFQLFLDIGKNGEGDAEKVRRIIHVETKIN